MTASRRFLLFIVGALLAGIGEGPAAQDPAASQFAPPPAHPRIEVRVRVSAHGAFLDDLKLEDFSLTEDGRPQTIASLSLVRGGGVARFEGDRVMAPRLDRSYVLLFQAVDWHPKLVQAIQYLFNAILQPGDAMTLITPFKPYQLQKDALILRSKKELSDGMEDVLRKDISRGGGEYRDLINDLKRLTRAISGTSTTFDEDLATDPTIDPNSGIGLEMQLERYRSTLTRLDGLRLVDEGKLEAFATSLRSLPGQKTVVFFYEREYRPELSVGTMNRLMALYQENFDIIQNLMELFQFYKREKKSQRVFGATMRWRKLMKRQQDPSAVFVGKQVKGFIDTPLDYD